jgi:hypothetical protein
MEKTLTFSDSAEGWVSFYSYYPERITGMNNYLYTFKGGCLYRHNANSDRNTFYLSWWNKHEPPTPNLAFEPSTITSVFNDAPTTNKLFKTLDIQGDSSWGANLYTDIQSDYIVDSNWFSEKEGTWFAFIRNTQINYALRSLNGIGNSLTIAGPANATIVTFAISPSPIVIGSIISIGDYIYFALPPSYSTPVLFGKVTLVTVNYSTGLNYLTIDTTIPGTSLPGIQTPYILYIKDAMAESYGILGHYCVFELTNTSTDKVELFTLETDVMKSFP